MVVSEPLISCVFMFTSSPHTTFYLFILLYGDVMFY